MAVIFDHWKHPKSAEFVSGFCIITTVANDLLRSIGVKRMPSILSSSDETHRIRSSEPLSDLLNLLCPHPSENLNGYPLSEFLKFRSFKDPSILDPSNDRLINEIYPLITSKGHPSNRQKGNSEISLFEPV